MEILAFLILLLFLAITPVLIITLLRFIVTGELSYNYSFIRALEFPIIFIGPLLFFAFDPSKNNCCGFTAAFSAEHRIIIYILFVLVNFAFFFSRYNTKELTPLIEGLLNTILSFGFVLNLIIAFHLKPAESIFGNLPIAILLFFLLYENHKKVLELKWLDNINSYSKINQFYIKILYSKIYTKFPVLLLLFIPILSIISSILLLFGQKPDAFILAFTETYKHGFSQLDYQCENVICGGHFLCSVAANGHSDIVKPIRYGERNGGKIICNRQLLVSNAFEELLAEKLPRTHRFIRKNYNKVGKQIHRHYHIFNRKMVSDIIYILMKPAELIFLLVLYTFDKKPENRIAIQYLRKADRQMIEKRMKP